MLQMKNIGEIRGRGTGGGATKLEPLPSSVSVVKANESKQAQSVRYANQSSLNGIQVPNSTIEAA